MSADPYAIRDRLERMDSLGAVSVQRLWPNKIDIHVEQREPERPLAGWPEQRRLARDRPARPHLRRRLILPNTCTCRASSAKTPPKLLPRWSRRSRNSRTSQTAWTSAYRIGGRRWDVKFKGRTDVVAFPDDARLMEQLDALNLMQAQNRVLDLPATRIDARHPKYIALQPMPGARRRLLARRHMTPCRRLPSVPMSVTAPMRAERSWLRWTSVRPK
jgi:hypothetical protein